MTEPRRVIAGRRTADEWENSVGFFGIGKKKWEEQAKAAQAEAEAQADDVKSALKRRLGFKPVVACGNVFKRTEHRGLPLEPGFPAAPNTEEAQRHHGNADEGGNQFFHGSSFFSVYCGGFAPNIVRTFKPTGAGLQAHRSKRSDAPRKRLHAQHREPPSRDTGCSCPSWPDPQA